MVKRLDDRRAHCRLSGFAGLALDRPLNSRSRARDEYRFDSKAYYSSTDLAREIF